MSSPKRKICELEPLEVESRTITEEEISEKKKQQSSTNRDAKQFVSECISNPKATVNALLKLEDSMLHEVFSLMRVSTLVYLITNSDEIPLAIINDLKIKLYQWLLLPSSDDYVFRKANSIAALFVFSYFNKIPDYDETTFPYRNAGDYLVRLILNKAGNSIDALRKILGIIVSTYDARIFSPTFDSQQVNRIIAEFLKHWKVQETDTSILEPLFLIINSLCYPK